jgi:hypothetical protein
VASVRSGDSAVEDDELVLVSIGKIELIASSLSISFLRSNLRRRRTPSSCYYSQPWPEIFDRMISEHTTHEVVGDRVANKALTQSGHGLI